MSSSARCSGRRTAWCFGTWRVGTRLSRSSSAIHAPRRRRSDDPAANVFRFTPDEAQGTAGLGAYAYHRLGWRRAALVVADTSQTWPEAAGFVAEFCSLGGRVDRVSAPRTGLGDTAARIPHGADGVVALTTFVGDTAELVGAYARRQPDLAKHLLLGPDALVFADAKTLRGLAPLLKGVVAATPAEYDTTGTGWRRFHREYLARFPGPNVLTFPANDPLFLGTWTATEAVAVALGRSHAGGDALRKALARTTVNGSSGPVRLDANRQAISSNFLVRFDPAAPSRLPTIQVVRNVEQTFGGYFGPHTPPPSRTGPGCHRATPPPWARN